MNLEYRIVGIGVVLVAAIFVMGALAMPIGSPLSPGAGLVPLTLGSAMLLAGAAVLILPRGTLEEHDRPTWTVWTILAVLAASIFIFEHVGFAATTFLATSMFLIVVERRPIATSLLMAVLLSGGGYLIFQKLLAVDLP